MPTEFLVAVSFDYATSAAGRPLAAIRVPSRWTLARMPFEKVKSDLVAILEKAGAGYHGCQSMPSRSSRDYLLVRREGDDELVVSSSEQLARFAFDPEDEKQTIWLELYYVGVFGEFQREQCLRLGGRRSVEVALAHCETARKFAGMNVDTLREVR